MGKNTLSKMLKTMCEEADVAGNKSNHSLRVYAATELFTAGIPEKVIQDRTGHRSLDGLCHYERISEKQKEEACKALAVKPGDTFMTSGPNITTIESQNVSMRMQVHGTNSASDKQPNFSFGSSSLHGCTITHNSLSEKEAKDLFD